MDAPIRSATETKWDHLGDRFLRPWGVVLGKVLAGQIIPELESEPELVHDSSTPPIRRYRH
jgi:hypothetical protein